DGQRGDRRGDDLQRARLRGHARPRRIRCGLRGSGLRAAVPRRRAVAPRPGEREHGSRRRAHRDRAADLDAGAGWVGVDRRLRPRAVHGPMSSAIRKGARWHLRLGLAAVLLFDLLFLSVTLSLEAPGPRALAGAPAALRALIGAPELVVPIGLFGLAALVRFATGPGRS